MTLPAQSAWTRGVDAPPLRPSRGAQGKLLADDATLQGSGVEEAGFVVVMATKKAKPAPSTPANAAATTAATPAAPAKPAPPAEPQPSPAEPTPPPAPEAAAPAPEAAAPAPPSAPVAALMEMGFPREECERALRAAFGDVNRAVEYLTTGAIPAGMGDDDVDDAGAGGDEDGDAEMDPNAPLDLFPQGFPAELGGGGGGAGAREPGPLDFLRNHEQFHHVRQMVYRNPEALEPLLQALGQQDPELLQLITDNQEAFMELLNESDDGVDDDEMAELEEALAQAGQALTAEDEEAVSRLTAMGFEREAVLEAYLACGKDENAAANFLLGG